MKGNTPLSLPFVVAMQMVTRHVSATVIKQLIEYAKKR
jgi:hypothetical protein